MKAKKLPFSGSGKVGMAILAIHALIAVVGPFVAPNDPGEIFSFVSFAPPGAEQTLLGTDYLGRDLLSRLLHGAGITISLAAATTALAFSLGVLIGFYAAEAGGLMDTLTFRFVDILISFPPILMAFVFIVGLGSSIPVLIFTVGVIQAPRVARIARAVAMDIGTKDFVEAARARGESIGSIMFREIWPNALMPLAAEFGLRLAYAVLLLAALSFLGLGIQPPMADWGALVRENMAGLYYGGWAVLLPALSIGSLVVGINLFVDALLARANRDVSREMLQ